MAPVWIDLDGMGWRVTSLPRIVFVISIKGKYIWRLFQQHKSSTNEWHQFLCDLDELGWRVTSQLPKIFWLYLRKENRYSVCFNGTNQHKQTALVWSDLGNMRWRVTVKKRMFNISNSKPAQTFVFAAQISTNEWHRFGDYFFYGVPTSRRSFLLLVSLLFQFFITIYYV